VADKRHVTPVNIAVNNVLEVVIDMKSGWYLRIIFCTSC
jgi:hypothetical protein